MIPDGFDSVTTVHEIKQCRLELVTDWVSNNFELPLWAYQCFNSLRGLMVRAVVSRFGGSGFESRWGHCQAKVALWLCETIPGLARTLQAESPDCPKSKMILCFGRHGVKSLVPAAIYPVVLVMRAMSEAFSDSITLTPGFLRYINLTTHTIRRSVSNDNHAAYSDFCL